MNMVNIKGKAFPANAMKANKRRRGTAQIIFNSSSRWRSVVNCKPWLL